MSSVGTSVMPPRTGADAGSGPVVESTAIGGAGGSGRGPGRGWLGTCPEDTREADLLGDCIENHRMNGTDLV